MKQILKFTIALVVGVVAFGFQSCEVSRKEDKSLFGFHFGQTSAQVDSVANQRGFRKLSWVNSTGYECRFDTLGVRWLNMEAVFVGDSLSAIVLRTDKNKITSRFFQKDINDVLYEHFHSAGHTLASEYLGEEGVWIYDEFLVSFISQSERSATLRIEPNTEINAKRQTDYFYKVGIEKNLKKLSQALYNYLKAEENSEYELKNVYGNDVREANKFLKEHYDLMTQKQKEFYIKLQNI